MSEHHFLAMNENVEVEEQIEKDGVLYNFWYGIVKKAIRATAKAPLVFLIYYLSLKVFIIKGFMH
jgi:hypothetical protein